MSEERKVHDWQCSYYADYYATDCCCGLTGERHWICDALPADRAPTEEEHRAYRAECARREGQAAGVGEACGGEAPAGATVA